MRIAVIALKGGSGKTFLSQALSAAAVSRYGSCLLVDADPQSSSLLWARQVETAGGSLAANVIGLPTSDLRRRLAGLGADRYPCLVLDTPPGDEKIACSALSVADVAICPVRPSVLDVSRAWATLELVKAAGVPALVVLSEVRARTLLLGAAQAALTAGGALVARTQVPRREAFAASYGHPVTRELTEIGAALLVETETLLPRRHRAK